MLHALIMGSQESLLAASISSVVDRRACMNGTSWIWHLLEECVSNSWEYWSVVIGLVSMICFLFAALPQLFVAHRSGKVNEALSLGFLLCWLGGDLTNFLGCYFTNQLPIQTTLHMLDNSAFFTFTDAHPYLPLQIFTAILYMNMDLIMLSQFTYYKLKKQKKKPLGSRSLRLCTVLVLVCLVLSVTISSLLLMKNQHGTSTEAKKDTLGLIETSGFICGYISCIFYLSSRFPQLYRNFQRGSTEGTSCLLFALAMIGNCMYGLSIVLKAPAGFQRNVYFKHHLPWLIGSFGVLFLDFFVMAQFVWYSRQKPHRSSSVLLEGEPLLVNEEES